MKRKQAFGVRPLSAVIVSAAFFPGTLLAAEQVGHVLAASGSIKAIGSEGKTRELNRRSPVYSGDRLVTSRSANAQVKFTDGAIVALKPSTELSVDEYSYEEGGLQKAFMSLVKGGFRTLTGAIGKTSQADYRVTTPVATIGIRGTLYDADYQPETGLDLAAWGGGIRACNNSGCVNLGSDADHRFGRIDPTGTFSGSDDPPSQGDGGQEDGTDPGSNQPEDNGEGSGFVDSPTSTADVNAEVSTSGGSGSTTNTTPSATLPTRAGFPLTGYAVAGTSNGSNLWGTKPGLSMDFARLVPVAGSPDEYFFAGTGSPLRSGQYLVSGWQECAHCSTEPMPGLPNVIPLQDSSIYWSWWDADTEWSEFSVSTNPDQASPIGVFNPGLFILGDFASPAVVGQMTGTIEFSSLLVEGFRNGNPAGGAAYGGGMLEVNLANQQVDGHLWLTPEETSSGYEYWNLFFNGQVNSSGFKLGLTPWSQASESGSHMTRWQSGDYMDYEDVGLLGNVEGRFVGTTQVDGLVGAFDVRTDESSPQTLAGIFGMERTTPIVPYDPYRDSYPVYGFMASSPGATPNPWSERILPLDYGLFTQYSGGEFPIWAMQAWGGSLASGSQVVSGWDCSTESCKATLMPMVWESNPGNPDNTTVYWGDWKGNYDYMYGGTSDLSVTEDFLPSADGVYNPGMYVFGTYASPAVVSQLVGSTDFYLSNAMMSIDGGQPSQTSGSGMMTVDLGMGTVSGAMQIQNPYVAETWSLAFSGTASTSGLDLSLESMGSFVDRGTGGVVDINAGASSMQAGFVGATDVHGVIGSFDANTQDTSPVNAQGVFLYQIGSVAP